MLKIKNFRWLICILLFVATSLSFLDRQVLSIVAPEITKEFQMSNTTYSKVTTAFIFSYAIMFFLGGRIIDWIGTRLGMILSVGFWSLASAVHGIVQNPLQLGIARFFLGVGEGGCFPGATKGATEWFPQKERATAIGIAIGGSALGAVIAPPMTVWLFSWVGWHGAFFATGILGAIWVLLWVIFFYQPKQSPFITETELAYIDSGQTKEEKQSPNLQNKKSIVPLKILLRVKQVWGLAFIRLFVDWVFYFYMFWIPMYLSQERNVSLKRIGEELVWIPFLALGISNIAGGWVSDRLIKSGVSVNKARKSIMTIAAILTVFSTLAAYAPNAEIAVAFMSLLMFAHGFWVTNYVTITSEMFDSNSVATVMGLCGTVGAIGGILANLIIGFVSDRFSFLPVWIASGTMYPLALLILFFIVGHIRRIELNYK